MQFFTFISCPGCWRHRYSYRQMARTSDSRWTSRWWSWMETRWPASFGSPSRRR